MGNYFLSCFSHVSFRKRMCIYFCLFIYYICQLAIYQSCTKQGKNPDSEDTRQYMVAVDSLLLIVSIFAIVSGWMFRNVFEKYYVVYNSFLFGLTFGWLILAAPQIQFHQSFYGLNITISLMLIIVDVIAQLYIRPEVITVTKPRKSSLWRPRATSARYGKIKTRNNSLEDGEALGIVPNPDNLKGKRESTVISDEERNSINSLQSNDQEEFFEGQSSVNSTSRAGSLSSFHPISHAELYNNEILYFGKVDLSEKGLCEGFRVNLGKLPQNNPNIPHNLTWEHFSHVHHLVDSSSCHIYTAFWDDLPVVLKLIKAERITSPVAVAEFEMEENILSRIRHPNIVRLLGSGTVPRKFLVLELLSGGSLSHSLGLRPDSQNQTWCKKFSFLETLRLAYDLSRALHYLHTEWSNSIHIIHRDIKPDNIGWTTDGHLKIFDFGLCVAVRAQREKTEQYRLTGNTGTLRYMAPEVVLGRSYNQTVDAYSFGILIWQVATGKIPFREMGKKPYFDRVVIGGQRPKLEPNWPMGFCNLLKVCWHEDKNLRPSFQKIMAELEILIKAEEDQVQKQENHLINRCSNLVLSLCLMTRPIVLFLVLGLFILALIVIIALNDTVSGSVLGMVSSFVIYAILMSYLKIWPTMTNLRRSRQFRANSLDMIEHFKRQSSPVPGGAGGGGESLQSLNNSSPVNGMAGSVVSHAIGESNLSVNRRHPSSAAAAVDHDDIELQAKPLTIVETSYSFNPLNRSVKRNGSISMV